MDENELTKNELNKRRSICVIATAILLCAAGAIAVKAEPLPFVLQNFIVVLAAAVFGGVQTSGAVGLFLLAGAFGLPVFAGGARGMAHLSTIRGNFLLGYFVAALVVGFMMKVPSADEKTPVHKIASSCLAGYAVIYVFPLIKILDGGVQMFAELMPQLVPYFIADLIKCAVTVPLVALLRPIAAKKLNQ